MRVLSAEQTDGVSGGVVFTGAYRSSWVGMEGIDNFGGGGGGGGEGGGRNPYSFDGSSSGANVVDAAACKADADKAGLIGAGIGAAVGAALGKGGGLAGAAGGAALGGLAGWGVGLLYGSSTSPNCKPK